MQSTSGNAKAAKPGNGRSNFDDAVAGVAFRFGKPVRERDEIGQFVPAPTLWAGNHDLRAIVHGKGLGEALAVRLDDGIAFPVDEVAKPSRFSGMSAESRHKFVK